MIQLGHEYHGCELQTQLPTEIKEWLTEKLGEPNGDRWYIRSNTIYFANKQDHMMFLIRVS